MCSAMDFYCFRNPCGYSLDAAAGKKEGMSQETVLDCVLIAVIAGIVGARLFYVFLYEPGYYLANPLRILYLPGEDWRFMVV